MYAAPSTTVTSRFDASASSRAGCRTVPGGSLPPHALRRSSFVTIPAEVGPITTRTVRREAHGLSSAMPTSRTLSTTTCSAHDASCTKAAPSPTRGVSIASTVSTARSLGPGSSARHGAPRHGRGTLGRSMKARHSFPSGQTSASRLKALLGCLEAKKGSAVADAWLAKVRIARTDLADETRRLPLVRAAFRPEGLSRDRPGWPRERRRAPHRPREPRRVGPRAPRNEGAPKKRSRASSPARAITAGRPGGRPSRRRRATGGGASS